jgi:asparagine synthase (glutamine-hydrolysing)
MFHFIAGERTAFASVTELKPGHFLRYVDGNFKVSRFWSPIPASTNGHGSSREDLRALLDAGVRGQLMADVPIGIMSSGGLDSGVVTAIAGAAQGRMRGFCYRDPQLGYDELDQARELSRPFGVEVEEVRVAPAEMPDLLMKLAWHYDEPLPRPHHIAAYAVARQAHAQGLKVLVSGEGGDEVFGGYSRYIDVAAMMATSEHGSPLVFGNNRVALPRIARFWSRSEFSNRYRFECAQETLGFDSINRQLLVDQQTFLQHFLQRSDRMGMAASVEIRVPLLDVPVVEYTNRLPGARKISNGHTKLCLKAAMHGALPSAVLERPKQAFELPMAPLLMDGPVARMVDDLLMTQPRCGVLFDGKEVRRLVGDFRAGQKDLWKIVWLLLTTEIWMRTFRVTV